MNNLKYNQVDRRTATISFESEVLTWDVFVYFRNHRSWQGIKFDKIDDYIFSELNDYLATLDRDLQKSMFEVIKEIHHVINNPTSNLDERMSPLMVQLINLTSLEDIKRWIDLHANIVIPSNIESHFTSNVGAITRERTYLREDYKWLVSLSIIMRMLMPIWGEYVEIVHREKGNNYKELAAVDMIKGTYIFNSTPMLKLKSFIESSIPQADRLNTVSLSAFSSEDFPNWLLSLVLVRKLTVDDIKGLDASSHLIKRIYQYLNSRVRGISNNFAGEIRDKQVPVSNLDDENSTSIFESYRTRQRLSPGVVELIQVYLNDIDSIVGEIRELGLEVSDSKLRESFTTLPKLKDYVLSDHQKFIIQVLLSELIPSESFLLVPKLIFDKIVCLSQCLLWELGFKELAILVSGEEVLREDGSVSLQYTGTRSRITREQLAVLNQLYPYNEEGENKTIEYIEEICNLFLGTTWKVNVPDKWLDESNIVLEANTNKFHCPNNIRIVMADFIIRSAQYQLFSINKDKGVGNVL